MRTRLTLILLSMLLAGSTSVTVSAQMSQTLPAGFDIADGNSSTAFPQNNTNDHRWQWHYDSTNFTFPGPILITEISVRASTPGASVGAFNFPSFTVTLVEASTHHQSTASGAQPPHSTTFANNILTSGVVKTGPWTGGPVPPSGATAATWIPFGLTGSFIFDPTAGNDFIVQIEKCGTVATWGASMDMGGGTPPMIGTRWGDTANCSSLTSSFMNVDLVPIVKIDFVPATTQADDMRMVSFDSPQTIGSGCNILSSTEPVTVTIQNFGMNPIVSGTSIPISYSVGDGLNPPTVVMENYVAGQTLNQFDSDTHTFATTADLSMPGTYVFDVSISLPGDLDPTNDAINGVSVGSGPGIVVSSFPWMEDFDASTSNGTLIPPAGFEQDPNDSAGTNSDWFFRNIGITPTTTGPDFDHTTGVAGSGYYAHVEDGGNFAAVNLITPCLDLNSLPNATLKFWVHSNNANTPTTTSENFLHVDILQFPGPLVTNDVLLTPVGHLGPDWTLQVVDLSAFNGATVQLRFRGTSDGGSSNHDIAIDDIEIFNATATNGQPPQANLAVLDINGLAFNGAGLPVSFGSNGPYFYAASVGSQVSFGFDGETNMPIIFLLGNLNVGASIFSGVGQLDIGGPLNMMTGLPAGITILADGNNPTGLNPFFNTGPAGTATIGFSLPAFPIGLLTTFQAAFFTSQAPFLAFSNAVEFTVQ